VTAATAPPSRQIELGHRLRHIRSQQGLSLAQVEQASDGRWKAVVVGAYERGDRAITIERLAGLAEFYGVPLAHLLPSSAAEPEPAPASPTGVQLDVARLEAHEGTWDTVAAVARFARRVRLLRDDHGGHVLTLRDGDLATIALAAGMEPEGLLEELTASGIVVGATRSDAGPVSS
jgi:transcriptional regulator with XRE-family HTH domain